MTPWGHLDPQHPLWPLHETLGLGGLSGALWYSQRGVKWVWQGVAVQPRGQMWSNFCVECVSKKSHGQTGRNQKKSPILGVRVVLGGLPREEFCLPGHFVRKPLGAKYLSLGAKLNKNFLEQIVSSCQLETFCSRKFSLNFAPRLRYLTPKGFLTRWPGR